MTDFVDPTVIAQINGAKDELIAEVAKITANSNTIEAYANSLPNPIIPEAPIDGKTYGRKDKAWVEVTGGGGSSVWGSITGTLSDQTDLQAALDLKADDADLATVAKTGAYSDLTGKPTVIAEAPADGKQYARINNAWAVVQAELAENPTLKGKLTVEDGANDLVIEQDNSYIYFSRPSPFVGQYLFRFRVGNTGLEFSTDSAGTVWTPVGGGASEPTNLGNTTTSDSVTITSSTGNDTTISAAGRFNAGVMSSADKTKLDGLENFNGTYTGDLTVRTNVDNYTILDPTSGTTNQFVTKFQAWGKFNSPFGDAEHQYDVNFKKDGVYHQDVKAGGSERRLAFVDELVSGGSSSIRTLTISWGKEYLNSTGTAVSATSFISSMLSGGDFTSDTINSAFASISPELTNLEWHLVPTAGDLSYLPTGAASGDDMYLKISHVDGVTYPYTNIWCQFTDLGSAPNKNQGKIYVRKLRGGSAPYDSGWKVIA